ncbi:S8 family peptidase [Levilinea saccharolytica]|uniref:S8 family peptidase n=1 Tax=Levilinea saccharolytica TaxID=229921 RepID=UPI0007857562|nr:S8 family serine peptidase [Levilinea saccharolytica]GAP17218.1 subtilisin-like serine proteases [Levilinea saccharolytica]
MSVPRKTLQWMVSALVMVSVLMSSLFFAASPAQAQDEPPNAEAESARGVGLSKEAKAKVADGYDPLAAKAAADGTVRVLVVLDVPDLEGEEGDVSAEAAQREVVAQAQDLLLEALADKNPTHVTRFEVFPFMAMTVDAAGLDALVASPAVTAVQEDGINEAFLSDSTKIVRAPEAWGAGYDGTGWTVAILDTGVDKNHPMFAGGKVVSEACYSGANGVATSVCPGGVPESTAVGSGVPCYMGQCSHGTHVAGIAAGKNTSLPLYGVAPGASIIAIQVFSDYYGGTYTWDSDYVKGLERVYVLRTSYNIASVNMSLGGGKYKSYCDSSKPAVKRAIDKLRGVKIATVIASGNDGFTDGMGSPSCISSAVAVGATDKFDYVASFSNYDSMLKLLAPGVDIYSSVPGNAYDSYDGTSMATPHVAGAWAVYRQARPSASVSEALGAFRSTGKKITDWRNGKKTPRLDLAGAVGKFVKPTAVPTLYWPTGGIMTEYSAVEFGWSHVDLASKYKITVKKGTKTVFSKTVNTSDVCDPLSGQCWYYGTKIFPTGSFTWTVKPASLAGSGPESAPGAFSTPNTLPAAVGLISPNGNYNYWGPEFIWGYTAPPVGDKYKLEIWKGTSKIFTKTYLRTAICNPGGCSIPAPKTFLAGSYTYRVTPWNPLGYGPAADGAFNVAFNGFVSEFNGDHTGWLERRPSIGAWFQSSTDFYSWYGPNYSWASANHASFEGNLDYTAVMDRNGDPYASNGIFIHGSTNAKRWGGLSSGYAFNYVNGGYYSIWRYASGAERPVVGWTYSSAINPTGYNTLRVTWVNGVMNFYINGTLLYSGTQNGIKSGVTGVHSFVMDWWDYNDYFYVDRAALSIPIGGAGAEALWPQAVEVDPASVTGSPAGPFISMAEYQARMSLEPAMTQELWDQKAAACEAAGKEDCPVK